MTGASEEDEGCVLHWAVPVSLVAMEGQSLQVCEMRMEEVAVYCWQKVEGVDHPVGGAKLGGYQGGWVVAGHPEQGLEGEEAAQNGEQEEGLQDLKTDVQNHLAQAGVQAVFQGGLEEEEQVKSLRGGVHQAVGVVLYFESHPDWGVECWEQVGVDLQVFQGEEESFEAVEGQMNHYEAQANEGRSQHLL